MDYFRFFCCKYTLFLGDGQIIYKCRLIFPINVRIAIVGIRILLEASVIVRGVNLYYIIQQNIVLFLEINYL